MKNVIEWNGKGWYASRQVGRHESQRVETVLVPFTSNLSSDDWDLAGQAATSAGLGTPVYALRKSHLK